MIQPGDFYVVTIGRQYLREFAGSWTIVGQYLEHAAQYPTQERAQKAQARIERLYEGRPKREQKPVGVRHIQIGEVR